MEIEEVEIVKENITFNHVVRIQNIGAAKGCYWDGKGGGGRRPPSLPHSYPAAVRLFASFLHGLRLSFS